MIALVATLDSTSFSWAATMASLVSRPPGRYQVVRPVSRARIANVATWMSTTSNSPSADALAEDFRQPPLVGAAQRHDRVVILRLQASQFGIGDEDLALPGHVIGDVEFGEGAELVDRPRLALQRAIELAQQFVDVVPHQVEQQFLLGRDVVVERARLDPDLGGKLAQAHGGVAMLEDQAQPCFADCLHRLRAV